MATALMAEFGNHAGNGPWPSLEWASWIFDRASFVLVGSLAVGVAATVAIVWMGIVKEHHWDLARDRSNEKVAALESETAKANAEIAKAQAATAEATLRLGELRLRFGPRNLNKEKFVGALAGKERYQSVVQIYFDKNAPDGWSTAIQIAEALTAAHWNAFAFPTPMPDDSPLQMYRPIGYEKSPDGTISSTGSGIVIVLGDRLTPPPGVHDALVMAMVEGFGHGVLTRGGEPTVLNRIALVIFPRL